MGEEFVAEADTLARPLEEAGHVRNSQLPPVRSLDRSEDGRDRREGIVRDLRLGVRDPSEKRGLACVREAQERRVGEQLQAQLEARLLADGAQLGEPRRLVSGRGEAAIARTAVSAVRCNEPRARVREVGEQPPLLVEHLGPHGYAECDVLAVGPTLVRPLPVPPPRRLEARLPVEEAEISEIRVGQEDDVPAVAAVAAVRAALRHELLPPEAERPVAAAPAPDADPRAVEEHGLS